MSLVTTFYLPLIYPARRRVMDYSNYRGMYSYTEWCWWVPRVHWVLDLKQSRKRGRPVKKLSWHWRPDYYRLTPRVPAI